MPALTSTFSVGTGGDAAKVHILHNTVQDGSALTAVQPNYFALESNKEYSIRTSGLNSRGAGTASAISKVTTAVIGILPSPPQSVTLGDTYGEDWLSVHYKPPVSNGGAEITKYKVEWDSSPSFSSKS